MPSSLSHQEYRANWQPAHRWPVNAIPSTLKGWLLDPGSLTGRLIAASHNAFSLNLLTQENARPRRDEAEPLGIQQHQLALIREVVLLGHNQPWVYARSIIPLSTLTGRLRALRQLENKPLGALLFADPGMRRGPLEIAAIPGYTIPAGLAQPDQLLWGRRSVFYLDNKPLLVSETFLPSFNPYNQPVYTDG